MSNFLSKAQIIAAQDRRYTEVDVPEWGGKVRLASLDADSSLKAERMIGKDTKDNPLSALLSYAIVDENGDRIFDEKSMEALGKKNPTVLVRLVEAMKALNKTEEKEKGNSEASPTEG